MATKQEYLRLLGTIGKAGLHALYPNDFEYYLLTLELVDSRGATIDLFTFPVMPNSISRNETELSTIKKSAGGITVLTTNTFVPIQFSIAGNFGRQLKVILGSQELNFTALSQSTQNGVFSRSALLEDTQKPAVFSNYIKTGYGATKVLNAIIDKSRALDNYNRPYLLYFYNPAFGESYVVRALSMNLSQNKDNSNAIWNYTLELKAIAKLENLVDNKKNSLKDALAIDFAQKALTLLGQTIDEKYINF